MASLHPENTITAKDMKDTLQDLALAAGGCMKAKPTPAQRARLRHAIGRALKALKTPLNTNSAPIVPCTDPVDMVARYVKQGGNWQALIAAITRHGRTGQTRQDFLTNPTKGTDYDKERIQH